jgi:DNA polymerase IV (DinB-like DNA polymerase)
MPQRIIIHLDMDHFFTAIEERENPKLKGKPVVVGADPKEGQARGVVSTCNYEARKFGIGSGMPISRAYKLCPDAEFLPVNMKLYVSVSEKVMDLIREYSDKHEQVSVDEMFLDVTHKVKSYEGAIILVKKIKRELKQKEKLTCSVGIGPNKLIAKIASDIQKPDGLTVVKPEKVMSFLGVLKVRKLWGVGVKTEERLHAIKTFTVRDLRKWKARDLVEKFGSFGYSLHDMARGIDYGEVEESEGVKSIRRERTYQKDTKDKKEIFKMIDKLSKEVYDEVKDYDLKFRTVTIRVRYEDFETHTGSKTLKFPTDKLIEIKKTAKILMERFLGKKKIRLVGVGVSNLVSEEEQKKLV